MTRRHPPAWQAAGRAALAGCWRRVWKLKSRVFVDLATPDSTVLLAGMGRSGTTWAADVINHDQSSRVVFEPFNTDLVEQARPFKYVQYMNRHRADPVLRACAERILNGAVRNAWVDADNHGFVFRRRLIKEIRANLMLAWLADVNPRMRIVLIVRHPLAVAASWLRLGWDADLEAILSQPDLLRDFPLVDEASRRIDVEDPVQRLVLQWCTFHHVPFSQAPERPFHVLHYENLLLRPLEAFEQVFGHLRRSYDPDGVLGAWKRRSPTHAGGSTDLQRRLNGWRRVLQPDQIRRAESLVSWFGLAHLYADDVTPALSA